MTAIDLDLTAASGATELGPLMEENEALRAYLKRVIGLLESKVEERTPRPTLVVDHAQPGLDEGDAPVRLAELESGLRRIEDDVQTVLWLLRGADRPAITSVD